MRLYQFIFFFILSFLSCFQTSADKFDDIRAQEGFIPYSQAKQLFADYDYICFDFDKETETCSQISEETTWWFKPAKKITLLFNNKPRILVRSIATFETVPNSKDLDCVEFLIKTVEIDAPTKLWLSKEFLAIEKKIKNEIINLYEKIGIPCTALFRHNAEYIIKTFDINGNPLVDYPPSIVHFFNSRPTLRPIDIE